MKQILIIIFVVILGVVILAGCSSKSDKNTENTYKQITPAEAKDLMDSKENYVILDVRTMEEFAEGHISNAINIPNENIGTEEIPELPNKNQLILVYSIIL